MAGMLQRRMAGVSGEALVQLEARASAAEELILLLRRQIGQVKVAQVSRQISPKLLCCKCRFKIKYLNYKKINPEPAAGRGDEGGLGQGDRPAEGGELPAEGAGAALSTVDTWWRNHHSTTS